LQLQNDNNFAKGKMGLSGSAEIKEEKYNSQTEINNYFNKIMQSKDTAYIKLNDDDKYLPKIIFENAGKEGGIEDILSALETYDSTVIRNIKEDVIENFRKMCNSIALYPLLDASKIKQAKKGLNRIRKPIQGVEDQIKFCEKRINENVGLCNDVKECLKIKGDALGRIYYSINKFGNEIYNLEKEFSLPTDNYEINEVERENDMENCTPEGLLDIRIKAIDARIDSEYQKRLESNPKYNYLIKLIKENSKIGTKINTFYEIEDLFEIHYKSKRPEDEKINEKGSIASQAIERGERKIREFADFCTDLHVFYNAETNEKNMQKNSINKKYKSCKEEIIKIISDYKEKLANNQFFSNLVEYKNEFGYKWMSKLENIQKIVIERENE